LAIGGRTPRASPGAPGVEGASAQGGVRLGSGATEDNGADILPGLVAGIFAAQTYAQEGDALFLASPRPTLQVVAAYRSAASQAEPDGAGDIQVPGQPQPLASGRRVDFTA